MKRFFLFFISIVLLSISGYSQTHGVQPLEIIYDTHHDVSPPLREMKMLSPDSQKVRWENNEVPNNTFLFDWSDQNQNMGRNIEIDPVLQSRMGNFYPINTMLNFEGLSNVNSVNPADPNGDIGLNYYIQATNLSFAIYSKSGSLVYGPAGLGTIWQGFPMLHTNDGDPIVLYDHLAKRWLISQFSLPNYPNGPYWELVAVSQTEDPLGSWNRYAFKFKNMPDYPKLGVWPDGYYISANSYSSGALAWLGPLAIVIERDSMLTGGSARMVSFQKGKDLKPMIVADLDGPSPPKNTPGYFLMPMDNAQGASTDQLQLFQLHTDWADTAKCTFTGPYSMNTAAFDMKMCGENNAACIPQKSTSRRLGVLTQYLMYRLQYRNFGTHQTMVVNHTVDADGKDHAGVRWYELRKSNSDWTIYQQGTYAPDTLHRWMASAAMDGNGNIGMGYSISGDALYPSIGVTGRKAGDPLGRMTCLEALMQKGSGSQTSESRWGDYSSLSIDPYDNKTFWYTNMYCTATSPRNWTTRIASFRIDDLEVGLSKNQIVQKKGNHLKGVFPNPVLQSTTVEWTLSEPCQVGIQILDLTGKTVAVPYKYKQQAGEYKTEYDASGLGAGVYICLFIAGGTREIQKLVVVK